MSSACGMKLEKYRVHEKSAFCACGVIGAKSGKLPALRQGPARDREGNEVGCERLGSDGIGDVFALADAADIQVGRAPQISSRSRDTSADAGYWIYRVALKNSQRAMLVGSRAVHR